MERLEVSCAVRPLYGSLGVKGLMRNLGFFLLDNVYLTFITPHYPPIQVFYMVTKFPPFICYLYKRLI